MKLKYIFREKYKDKQSGDIVDSYYFKDDDILIHYLLDSHIIEYVMVE